MKKACKMQAYVPLTVTQTDLGIRTGLSGFCFQKRDGLEFGSESYSQYGGYYPTDDGSAHGGAPFPGIGLELR